jgi:hypothetical protein
MYTGAPTTVANATGSSARMTMVEKSVMRGLTRRK